MQPGARMGQEVDQYFYTAAPIGGTGFHIVGGPDGEGADAEAVRRLIRNLVQYQIPFDLSPHASEAEIAERFPVAVRAACTEQGSAVVLRSCYIGPEYQSDGPGSRPGNYFGHALVLEATAPGVGPMTVARAAESARLWRTGLLPEELGSRDELKLPRIAVDLTASEEVEARHEDEPVLAGLIARIAGGAPVFLANTPWSEAFAVFQRVERFLPPGSTGRLTRTISSAVWTSWRAKVKRSFRKRRKVSSARDAPYPTTTLTGRRGN